MLTEVDRSEIVDGILAATQATSATEALAAVKGWRESHEQAAKARQGATCEALISAAIHAGRIQASSRDAYLAHGAIVGAKALGEQLAALRSTKMESAEQLIATAVRDLRIEPAKRDLFARVAAATDPSDFAEVVGAIKPRVHGPGSAPRPRSTSSPAVDAELSAALKRAGVTPDDYQAHATTDDEEG